MTDRLKAWSYWAKLEKPANEDKLLMARDIDDLIAEVDFWRRNSDEEARHTRNLSEECERANTEIERLRAELAWYGDLSNWSYEFDWSPGFRNRGAAQDDEGKRARAALGDK